MTGAEILNLRMQPNESGATTVRGYLIRLLQVLWQETDGFSGKYPFGDSGWIHELYEPLVTAGLVRPEERPGYGAVHWGDRVKADQLIAAAITALGSETPGGSAHET